MLFDGWPVDGNNRRCPPGWQVKEVKSKISHLLHIGKETSVGAFQSFAAPEERDRYKEIYVYCIDTSVKRHSF